MTREKEHLIEGVMGGMPLSLPCTMLLQLASDKIKALSAELEAVRAENEALKEAHVEAPPRRVRTRSPESVKRQSEAMRKRWEERKSEAAAQ